MIQVTPPRRFKTMLERVRNDNQSEGRAEKVTFETVEAALPGGQFQVLGTQLSSTGIGTGITAGQTVPVGWKGGKPLVIIEHHAQSEQHIRILPSAGAVIEELFIATNPATSQLDVWFRNRDQLTPLGLTKFLHPSATVNYLDTVQWAQRNDNFLLYQQGNLHGQPINVFKLNRQSGTSYNTGQVAKATLQTTITLDSITGIAVTVSYQSANYDNNVFGSPSGNQFTVPNNNLGFGLTDIKWFFRNGFSGGVQVEPAYWSLTPGADSFGVTPQSILEISSTPIQLVMDERGHLLVVYDVHVGDSAAAGGAFLGSFETTMIVDVTPSLPFVVVQPVTPTRAVGANQNGAQWGQTVVPVYFQGGNLRVAIVPSVVNSLPTPTSPITSLLTLKAAAGPSLQNGVLAQAALTLFANQTIAGAIVPQGTIPGQSGANFQATRRHIVWADTSNANKSLQNVFAVFLDPSAPSGLFGAPVLIGSGAALVALLFTGSTFPIRLLEPDFIYDSRNSGGLFFPRGGWSIGSPRTISAIVDSPDPAFNGLGNMKVIPTNMLGVATPTFAPYPEQPNIAVPFILERGMAWQAVDDPAALVPVSRFVPPLTK